MCAPFVLAQAATGIGAGGGRLQRLAGAALLPYQAGRMLGYGALGAVAGGAAGLVTLASGLRWVLAALLLLAAAADAGAGLEAARGLAAAARPGDAAAAAARWSGGIGALLADPTGWRGVLLGVLLSALPCGLLYAALAAAAAGGSALAGGLGMVAFVLGTVPALAGVALLGRFFARGRGPGRGWRARALFALNGVVLLAMAARLVA